MKLVTRRQHTGTGRGKRRLFGIREDDQTLDTGGRASYLKREGKVSDLFKIKQEMTRQNMKQNINRDTVSCYNSE